MSERGFGGFRILVTASVLLVVVGVGGLLFYKSLKKTQINSFEECVAAGNPVMESFPEQCHANGTTYINSDGV